MTRMIVMTPSFRGDHELCADLNRSVLSCTGPEVEHHLVVPRRDLRLFATLDGPRTVLRAEEDFLPRSFVALPWVNYTVSLRAPFPPVRGWIKQQILKLAAVARTDADVVVMVDSDIQFIRPFTASTFLRDGVVRFYRQPGGVDAHLPRHVIWHQVARTLLGLPTASPPHPDYVSSLLAWSPGLLRELLERVEHTSGVPWPVAVGRQLHFSEWTLYGVYVDEVAGPPATAFAADRSLCHSYWDEVPLDERTAAAFLDGLAPDDIAVMISAKSRTPLAVRRAALRAVSAAAPDAQ